MMDPDPPSRNGRQPDATDRGDETEGAASVAAGSRSEQRRDAIALRELGLELVRLRPERLATLGLDEELRQAVLECHSLKKGARSRQLRRIAKLLRSQEIPPIVASLAHMEAATDEPEPAQRAPDPVTADWGQRLLDGGDAALQDYLREHPQADRGQLRTLVRRATRPGPESVQAKAMRDLLRVLAHE